MYPKIRLLLVVLLAAVSAQARPVPPRVAAIGDSLTDEYGEQDYGNVAKSWAEILVQTGRIDMGPTAAQAGVGLWDDVRRTGYRDNWARYADRTGWALANGQHRGAARAVRDFGVEYVVIMIGGNDFAPWDVAYDPIYWGTWTQAQIDAYVDQRVANIRTMVDVVQAEGGRVLLLSTLDFNFSGFARNNHFFSDNRERVTRAVGLCRDRLRALAMEKGLVFLDLFRLNIDLFGPNDAIRPTVMVGNQPIVMQETGDDGSFGFVYDGVHPQRVVQSIWARAIVASLDAGFHAGIPEVSEAETLAIGGLSYGGADTLPAVLRPMSEYIQNFGCIADYNVDGHVGVQDIFAFLVDYFGGDVRADLDAGGDTTVGDVFVFLEAYFAGCAP